MHTFNDAKLFVGGVEIAEIESGSYECDSEAPSHDLELTPGVQLTEIIGTSLELDQHVAKVLQFCWFSLLPSITPDGTVRGACVGVFAWRMLFELQAPLHRRAVMSRFWVRAMQARYVVCAGCAGLPRPGVVVGGNAREVIDVYDRIRKEAGDFDADELGGLN
jgi:hypothetical protein